MTNEQHVHWGKVILRNLVGRVIAYTGGPKFVYYSDLANEIKYPEPLTGSAFSANIGKTLFKMGHLLDNLPTKDWPERIPHLQSLVVTKADKLPGDGLQAFYPDYPSLPVEKKHDYVNAEYQKIFQFGHRWLDVLRQLGVNPPEGVVPSMKISSGLYNPYGKDGSPEHQAIRDYILKNPSSVKVNTPIHVFSEYKFKSNDAVDAIAFESRMLHVIEVKSSRSGDDDIERGIYQGVKYRALLQAEELLEGRKLPIRAVLVLEGSLPPGLRKAADLHSIIVIDNFSDHRVM
jgi:hypothetical protein